MVDVLRGRWSALGRVGAGLVGVELAVGAMLPDPWRVHAQLTRSAAGAVGIGGLLLVGACLSGRRDGRGLLVDPLTGAGTRAAAARTIDAGLRAAAGAGAGPVTVVRVDLDGLAEVHGSLGPEAADELLVAVAARLRALARGGFVARLDGASFVMVGTDLADGADALAFAERVRDALHRPVGVRGLALGVQAHLGLALGPEHGADADTLLRRADLAAQRARRGPDPTVLFEASLACPTPDRLALVADLRGALEARSLRLEYQPVMHLPTGRVAGVEALLRWTHPTRGALAAAGVVDLAERSGLAGPLTEWVLDEALRQCRAWCDAGSYLAVSVNVSAHCLADEGFADVVESAMARYDVPAHLLEIELTESAVPDDAARARRVLGRLHRLGVNIAIDGFGTGHASLAYLQTLPVDTIKIAGSFVAGLGHHPGDGTIVRAIVALGRALGLQVVAEGVHDDTAARFLLDVGCELGQGYRWARPMAGDAVHGWARACDAAARPVAD